jgi:predicted YcjX-like family ATPase
VSHLYISFLDACCAVASGLKLLQPGGFLVGHTKQSLNPNAYVFCPLPAAEGKAVFKSPVGWVDGTAARVRRALGRETQANTLRAEMERRFEEYKKEIVAPFYLDRFLSCDRQVVLVDVLTMLNTSHECFYDARNALSEIMESFRYGGGSLIAKLTGGLIGSRVDRVLFAATKADHVTRNQYANLKLLLTDMVADKAGAIQADGSKVCFMETAAVKSTKNVLVDYLGQPLPVLRGILKSGSGDITDHYPGVVPGALPGPAAWKQNLFKFADFAPPRLEGLSEVGIRHINLDKVLAFLM